MSCVTFGNTVLRWLEHAHHGERVARTPLPVAPVFVLGHWRAGTTLLHELLMLDGRFSTPTTHDCFLPCHPLLSRDFVLKYLGWAMPAKRPMDNMAAGWERPQEDEFALALLGEPSTYTDLAFPNNPPLSPGALDLAGLTPRERTHWQRTLARFARTLTARDPRPLVLKSPPHTARIPELLELFPHAKFVHIRRDPFALFASTVNLWESMARKHGLQTPRGPKSWEDKVFREFRTLYTRYLATRDGIPAGNLVEVRFEEFAPDLVAGMRQVYEGLNLGGFDAARPALEAYAAKSRGYERNRFTLTEEQTTRIRAEWGGLMAELGYGDSG